MADKYSVIEVKDWAKWIEEIDKLPRGRWVFRGQPDDTFLLKTSLYRYFEDVTAITKIQVLNRKERERLLIDSFKKCVHLYLKISIDSEDDVELLALMQHYNAPTRLLDVTKSPYIALYFAVTEGLANSAVFAFNPTKMKEIDKKQMLDNSIKHIFKNETGQSSFITQFEPRRANERSLLQQGSFLVPSNNTETFEDILAYYPENTVCKKFIIDKNLRGVAIKKLVEMNITSKTLFPGLDGFCRSLRVDYMAPLIEVHK